MLLRLGLNSSPPPALASQSAGIRGLSHCARLCVKMSRSIHFASEAWTPCISRCLEPDSSLQVAEGEAGLLTKVLVTQSLPHS